MQRLSAITHVWFGLFRVRSPLLTESRLFSFPVGTEMFHFPTFPPTALCVQAEVAGHYSGFFRGFPIRRSPDRSSFTSSPGLIAGYNVLHRLLVPRHPPIALSSLLLTTKMLASTVKFSRCGRQRAGALRRRCPIRSKVRCVSDRTLRTQQRAWAYRLSCRGSTPDNQEVLTTIQPKSLLVNVPHSGACSIPVKRWKIERWTDLSICQTAP